MNSNGPKVGWFVIVPVGAVLAWFGLAGPSNQQPTSPPSQEKVVYMAHYNRIYQGMKKSDVESVVGSKGQQLESGSGYEIICWKNPDGSNMIVQFEYDRVVTKAQCGLSD